MTKVADLCDKVVVFGLYPGLKLLGFTIQRVLLRPVIIQGGGELSTVQ